MKEQEMQLYQNVVTAILSIAGASVNRTIVKEIANDVCDDFRHRFGGLN